VVLGSLRAFRAFGGFGIFGSFGNFGSGGYELLGLFRNLQVISYFPSCGGCNRTSLLGLRFQELILVEFLYDVIREGNKDIA
jgi:hypothetical protein